MWGKSTLTNRILGERSCGGFDMPGTTRDSIYIQWSVMDSNIP